MFTTLARQGNAPSPQDRIRGCDYARSAFEFALAHYDVPPSQRPTPIAGTVGLLGSKCEFIPFSKLVEDMDQVNRRPKNQLWWKQFIQAAEQLRTQYNVRSCLATNPPPLGIPFTDSLLSLANTKRTLFKHYRSIRQDRHW